VPFDIIIIPNIPYYVKKSGFLSRIVFLGINIDQAPDFINRSAAVLLEMGSHDISCTAYFSFRLHWRLLHFVSIHAIALLVVRYLKSTKTAPSCGHGFDMY